MEFQMYFLVFKKLTVTTNKFLAGTEKPFKKCKKNGIYAMQNPFQLSCWIQASQVQSLL